MQQFFCIGNLTADVELIQLSEERNIANFSVAVKRPFSEETDFFKVEVWGNQANNCNKYLKKGSCVAVKGYIKTKNYEDSNGNKKFTFYIKAEEVRFLSSRNSSVNKNQSDYEPIDESNLPF